MNKLFDFWVVLRGLYSYLINISPNIWTIQLLKWLWNVTTYSFITRKWSLNSLEADVNRDPKSTSACHICLSPCSSYSPDNKHRAPDWRSCIDCCSVSLCRSRSSAPTSRCDWCSCSVCAVASSGDRRLTWCCPRALRHRETLCPCRRAYCGKITPETVFWTSRRISRKWWNSHSNWSWSTDCWCWPWSLSSAVCRMYLLCLW